MIRATDITYGDYTLTGLNRVRKNTYSVQFKDIMSNKSSYSVWSEDSFDLRDKYDRREILSLAVEMATAPIKYNENIILKR